MKIAILMDAPLCATLFAPADMAALHTIGEISANPADKVEKADVLHLIQDADIAITSWGVPQLDEEILNQAPGLQLVAHAAGSVKSIVSDALYSRGIRVISSAQAMSVGVSDTALGLTIAACKDFFAQNAAMHTGGWIQDYSPVMELCNITVGVIGYGIAGRHYVELLQNFPLNVLVYDPYHSDAEINRPGVRRCGLEELLKSSDVVSIHAPSIPETHHMINTAALDMMKDKAILINTARGSLVDEAALAAAMTGGKLKYACLDVYDPEPPAEDSPLRRIPNCILTPHIAGAVTNGKLRIGTHVLREIRRYLGGEPLVSEVTKDMLSTMA